MRGMVEKGELRPSTAARLFHVSRSSLYKPLHPGPVHRPRQDESVMRARVRRVAEERITYGYRRIWGVLRRQQGVFVNRKRVRRIPKAEGLQRAVHFPRPRLPSNGSQSAEHPNERWFSDITYLETTDLGLVGLTVVEDTCTREILAWPLLPSCGAVDTSQVLEDAVMERFPETGKANGVSLRTDGGSQFTSSYFQERARQLGVHVEAYRKRRPEDGGLIESFNGHWKSDYPWTMEPTTFEETRQLTGRWIKDYNEARPHSSLDYLTPKAFYATYKMEEKE
jgi:putative transposase